MNDILYSQVHSIGSLQVLNDFQVKIIHSKNFNLKNLMKQTINKRNN